MYILTSVYLVYLFMPMILLLVGSFGQSWMNTLLPHGLTTQWYVDLWLDGSFQRAFLVSMKRDSWHRLNPLISTSCPKFTGIRTGNGLSSTS